MHSDPELIIPLSCAPKCSRRRRPALWGAESPGDQQDIRAQRNPRGLRCDLWPPQHDVQHGLHSDPGELQRPLQPADDELHQGDREKIGIDESKSVSQLNTRLQKCLTSGVFQKKGIWLPNDRVCLKVNILPAGQLTYVNDMLIGLLISAGQLPIQITQRTSPPFRIFPHKHQSMFRASSFSMVYI